MASSLNQGPDLGPQHSTARPYKNGPKRDPKLESYPDVDIKSSFRGGGVASAASLVERRRLSVD